MLPNFLCVGAQRSGTTTLHYTLSQHPDIFLPQKVKETNFFNLYYPCGSLYYERAFFSEYNGESAVGEITPIYMYYPEVAPRIVESLGEVKLIISLRNPAERAYSHYKMNYGFLWESETFKDAIELEQDRIKDPLFSGTYSYLDLGYYAKQIKRLLEFFPKENLLFVVAEQDTYVDLQKTANRIFNFLGVKEHDIKPLHANKTTMPKIEQFANDTTIGIRNGEQVQNINVEAGSVIIQGGFSVPFSITRQPTVQFNQFIEKHKTNLPNKPLSDNFRKEIINRYFLKDIAQLESLIDRDLSIWRD